MIEQCGFARAQEPRQHGDRHRFFLCHAASFVRFGGLNRIFFAFLKLLPPAPMGFCSLMKSSRRWPGIGYAGHMALVRILVDGYSLLHNWSELAPGKPRYSAAAREELIYVLTRYHDSIGTPVTIVFDGSRPSREKNDAPSSPEVEILYSHAGQTADQMIERAACRLKEYGDVLVVTDDFAERDTVSSFGATALSCESFIRSVKDALDEMDHEIKQHNRQERTRYGRH
jgi:predicted RNA-binding protein with PIN domain